MWGWGGLGLEAMSDATSLPDLGFLIGSDGGFQDDYVPPEAPAFDVEDAMGADDDGAWPEIAVPGGAFGEPSVWEEAPASSVPEVCPTRTDDADAPPTPAPASASAHETRRRSCIATCVSAMVT